jgi:hypothetical protein
MLIRASQDEYPHEGVTTPHSYQCSADTHSQQVKAYPKLN